MGINKSELVDEYISGMEPKRQDALLEIRALIFDLIPGVVETMKYRMPTYELNEVVLCMASQKHHLSLYMDTELVAKYRQEFGHLNCGKSCIRFKQTEDLPMDTIKKIILETIAKQA